MKRIILVDGNSLMYRAYFATAFTGNLMQNSKGLYTNAIYSFIKMLDHLVNQEYDNILVAFDAGKQTFRHEILDSYKDGRSPMPEEMRVQIPHIKEYLHLMNIKEYQLPLYEADDIIGTMASLAISEGYHVDIYSSDKDLLQLVNENTTVHLTKKGMTELEDFTPEHVVEKYGLTYHQMVDLKALMGDPSDNLKGLPGVGEKTAVKLLQQYGSLEELIAQRDSVSGKLGEKVREFYEDALICQKMCTINRTSPLEISLSDTSRKEPDFNKLNEFYRFLEFYSILKKSVPVKTETTDYKVINNAQELKEILLPNSYLIFEMMDYNYHKAPLLAIGLKNKLGTFIIKPELLDQSIDLQLYLRDENNKNIFDLKRAKVWLLEHGYDLCGVEYDMMLASYICVPSMDNSDFNKVCNHFEYNDVLYDENVYGKGVKRAVPSDEMLYNHIAKKCSALENLKTKILNEIENNGQLNLLNNIEIPLACVLAKMEVAGMKIDLDELNKQKVIYEEEIKQLESKIFELAGMEFNIQSPKQLGEVLFEKLGLPVVKKNKSGSYTTDIEVLNYLADKHEIINYIIRYRTVTKLYQTYLVGLEQQVYEDGKVHTIFEQALTVTGRLSSIEPNVQNIPIRTSEGRNIRKLFVPSSENLLFSSDYSQIELRVLAHMANVGLLIEAFKENIDVHTLTAKKIFGVEEVTSDLRRKAKAVNFGIVYGISAFGLSNDVELGVKEAQQFIDSYFELYPEIKKFMDTTVSFAKEAGYVVTLSNRRRYIPELKSPVYMQREFGKRTAMNAPIQGSAADIIKMAMINIDNEITNRKLKSKMVFQVHDELVFEVVPEEREIIEELVLEEMRYAAKLSVPLDVASGFGSNWMEIK